MIEGSGSRAGSGSIPLTSGSVSGSGRPKNMWIRWIRIRIRIRNTGYRVTGERYSMFLPVLSFSLFSVIPSWYYPLQFCRSEVVDENHFEWQIRQVSLGHTQMEKSTTPSLMNLWRQWSCGGRAPSFSSRISSPSTPSPHSSDTAKSISCSTMIFR